MAGGYGMFLFGSQEEMCAEMYRKSGGKGSFLNWPPGTALGDAREGARCWGIVCVLLS